MSIPRIIRLFLAATLVVVLATVLVPRLASSVHVCDAWSVTLKDGTVLTPPPEVIASSPPESGGYGPCWALPWWVTMDDIDQTPGTQPPTVGD